MNQKERDLLVTMIEEARDELHELKSRSGPAHQRLALTAKVEALVEVKQRLQQV